MAQPLGLQDLSDDDAPRPQDGGEGNEEIRVKFEEGYKLSWRW